jgi:cobalt-zinc-cadmium efflux system protein
MAHSVALLADAGHNFGDVVGLLLAWAAHSAAQKRPTERYTYGYRSASILAALANALLLATGAIVWEAIGRLAEPGAVAGGTVMIVAGIGIAVNAGSALLLMAGRKDDLNIKGAFLHLVGDAAVSAGVVAAGAVIYFTGWSWLDPAASIAISIVIVWTTWGLLRDALRLSLDAVPNSIDPVAVRRYLEGLTSVASLHDLHIWGMGTRETALTVHLVMPGGHPGDAFLMSACKTLSERFGISHATMQIEVSENTVCPLASSDVV